MTEGVKQAFLMEREFQSQAEISSKSRVDGYDDFIFVNRYGDVQNQGNLNKALRRMMRDCNDEILEKYGADSDPVPVKNADGEGLVIVRGLEDDAYTVTEIRTDNGYTLLKDNIKIVISQVEATELCDIYSSDLLGLVQNDPRYAAIIKDTGNLKNMPQPHLEHHLLTASATVDSKDVNMLDDDGSANAIVPLKVINTRGFDLPQTGDSGTMAFSIIGILLMACAAVVIVMVFRKKGNSN